MPDQLTTAEMRARLEELRKLSEKVRPSDDMLMLLDLASAELARREREEKGAEAALDYWRLKCLACGHRRAYHLGNDGMGQCPYGAATMFQLTDSPVTDGEAG